eukprot:TRINITY_DN6433_c0_g1_i1.p1 TRINITY_DN6433_c0_g1~~TRINITY_DN6433_c0_g1_i1.p1  ORF type:complete len:279 (+),score=32.22 TRINITY_DN6433_c0_g1_i1:119-955(+)
MQLTRFYSLIRKLTPFSLHNYLLFSSSSASAGFSSLFNDQLNGESTIYRQRLRFQRPTTKISDECCRNSVSFIGSVKYPVKQFCTRNGSFGVYTFLEVRSSLKSNSSFLIFLEMWNKVAEISSKHLTPKDLVYVAGHLGSYIKNNANGEPEIVYKVRVKELNYVAWDEQGQSCQKRDGLGVKEEKGPVSSAFDREMERLHLWQVFFAKPDEWWDNRQGKSNPRRPDFKHKDTGECLWVSDNDPPWVKKQLQLQDSKQTESGQRGQGNAESRLYMWELV